MDDRQINPFNTNRYFVMESVDADSIHSELFDIKSVLQLLNKVQLEAIEIQTLHGVIGTLLGQINRISANFKSIERPYFVVVMTH